MIVKTLTKTTETIVEILDDLESGNVVINVYTRVNPNSDDFSYYGHNGHVMGVNHLVWTRSYVALANDMVIDVKTKKKGGD